MTRASASVAVTSRSFSRHPQLRAELLERYPKTTFNDAGLSLEGEALVDFLRGHDKAITALECLTADVLSALPELRVVSKYGVGLDMLDLDAMDRHRVALGWTPGVNCRSVAELALAFALALRHRVPESQSLVREGKWQQVRGRQLSNATVGVIGCGHVGKDVIRLARPLGCRILVYDIRHYEDFYRQYDVVPVSLETLLAEADVVTLHVPLNATTRNILDEKRIALLRPTAVVINTARGGLVDEDALGRALLEGKLFGAACDVFEDEPPAKTPLLTAPNVIATTHIGGSTEEAQEAMGRAAISGLDDFRFPAEYGELIER